jgi:hypothetical protein
MCCGAPSAMIAGRLVSGALGTSAVTHRRLGETDWNSPMGYGKIFEPCDPSELICSR